MGSAVEKWKKTDSNTLPGWCLLTITFIYLRCLTVGEIETFSLRYITKSEFNGVLEEIYKLLNCTLTF